MSRNLIYPAVILLAFALPPLTAQEVQLVIPTGHTELPYSVQFSADSKYILTGGGRTAILWEAATGRMIYTLSGHQFMVTKALFSADEKHILTTSPLELKLWETRSGQLIGSYLMDVSKQQINLWIQKCHFDGYQLHTYDRENTRVVWNVQPMKPVANVIGPIQLSSADSLLLPPGQRKPAELIVSDNKRAILFQVGRENGIEDFVVDDGNKLLAIGTKDSLLQVWRLLDKKLLRELKMDDKALRIDTSPDGVHILTVGLTMDPFLLNTENWMPHYLPGFGPMGWASFSPDSRYLLIPGFRGARLYDIENRKVSRTFEVGAERIHNCAISPDNQYFLTISEGSNTIKVWHTQTEQLLYTLGGHTVGLAGAQLSPDGRLLVTWVKPFANQKYNYVRIWDMQTGAPRHIIPTMSFLAPRFSPDSRLLLMGDQFRTAKVIDAETSETITAIGEGEEEIIDAFFTGDGAYAMVAHEAGFEFRKTNASPARIPPGKAVEGLQKVLMNTQKNKLYALSADNILRIFSFPELRLLDSVAINSKNANGINIARLSPSEKYLALADLNKHLEIWDIKTGKKRASVDSIDRIQDLAFSQDDQFIVSISRGVDNTGAIIRARDGKILRRLGQNGGPKCMAMHPEGKVFALGNMDNTVTLWSLKTGRLLKTLAGHQGEITHLAYTADGKRLATASLDGTCTIRDHAYEEICTFISIQDEDFLCLTPEKYYYGSKNAARLLNWRQGLKLYGFDQFDLQFNRPDKVMARLGLAGEAAINTSCRAYLKRLERLGFSESDIDTGLHVPEITIVDRDRIPLATSRRELAFAIAAKDSLVLLDRLNVWVNGVPEYGIKGQSMREDSIREMSRAIYLQLSEGTNLVEVSVHNQKGVESLRSSFRITLNVED
ncbi:MAG: WD40 repeat domain-containing protein [Phaeodactylibacter sp.]|nr:WD40 repeat domain-containing protein [Phaeodactylibacter sp.]